MMDHQKLEIILTKVKEGIIVVDHGGRLMLVNPAARALFGLGEARLSGKPVGDVFRHPDLLECLSEEKAAAPFRAELNLEDGRILNAQFTPIAEVGLVVTMQDITYLKELDRIKSDFVHTVSHDLRSPLTAILGYIELIERVGPINDQQREFIRRVQVNVHNITALIDDLLDLGRIEAGFDTRNEILSLADTVHFVVESLRDQIAEKNLAVTVNIPGELPALLGNPLRLRQMLNNLIDNSIKYTPPGGSIHVQVEARGEQIILQISDTGPGIPPGDQPFIFDKFYRARNIAEGTPGTGLGLAIVKSIVENHHGRIWVNSFPGEGATFTIVLPTIEQEL